MQAGPRHGRLFVEVPGDETSNEWLEAVDNTVYLRTTILNAPTTMEHYR